MNVYIIYSESLDSFYTGFCKDVLQERIEKHIKGMYDDSYTKKASDWILVWHLECFAIKQALQIEKHIKRMKSKVYIQNLIKYPEISAKLLEKYTPY
jgi:putative endonuclease